MNPLPDALIPIPLSVLTGALGAGKTSRLNAWLREPALADTLVIINEFGAIGLDHLLVENAPGDVVLLAAGCMCCTLRGDIVTTLEDLLRRRDNQRIPFFRRVVIETSGLADPAPVLQAVLQHPYLKLRFTISGLLALVDGVSGAETLETRPDARKQVMLADAILITKTDLADAAALAATCEALANLGVARAILTGDEAQGAGALLAQRFDPKRLDRQGLSRWIAEEIEPVHAAGLTSFSLVEEISLTEAQITVFQEAMRILHGPRLLRMKGLVASSETPDQPVILHQVQSAVYPPVRLAGWPNTDRRTRIVFIVEGIPEENIRAFWAALIKT